MSNYIVDDVQEGVVMEKICMQSSVSCKSTFLYFVLLIMLEQYVESNHSLLPDGNVAMSMLEC